MGFFQNLFKRQPKTSRPPQFAGHYYPEQSEALSQLIEPWLQNPPHANQPPRALVVPFGQLSVIAPSMAPAYALLYAHAQDYDHIFMFAPSLRIPFRALATSFVQAWTCPLGHIWLNEAHQRTLIEHENVRIIEEAHLAEPSLEVQLPLLYSIRPEWTISPLLMGDGSPDIPFEIMKQAWHTPKTLILIATEFSNELTPEDAIEQDEETLSQLLDQQPTLRRAQTSGRVLMNALSRLSAECGGRVEVLARHHSGQTIEPAPPLVVSYASLVYYEG